MHPLLRATRAQRIRDRAIDIFGAIFWITFLLALLGGVVAAFVL